MPTFIFLGRQLGLGWVLSVSFSGDSLLPAAHPGQVTCRMWSGRAALTD